MRHALFAFWVLCVSSLSGARAGAQSISLSSVFPDLNGTIGGLGLIYDHRPYLGATALNAPEFSDEDPDIQMPSSQLGLAIGAETTLTAVPAAVSSLFGSSGSLVTLPFFPGSAFPVLRLIAHKGLGPRVDIGVSGFWFPPILPISLWSIGGDIKVTLWHQSEGITVATRLGFAYTHFGFSSTDTTTVPGHTIGYSFALRPYSFTPHLLISKKMNFIEPYIGVAYQFVFGGVYADSTFDGTAVPNGSASEQARYGAAIGYLGVTMIVPGIRLSLTPEMTYSTAGAYSLGFKTGVSL